MADPPPPELPPHMHALWRLHTLKPPKVTQSAARANPTLLQTAKDITAGIALYFGYHHHKANNAMQYWDKFLRELGEPPDIAIFNGCRHGYRQQCTALIEALLALD